MPLLLRYVRAARSDTVRGAGEASSKWRHCRSDVAKSYCPGGDTVHCLAPIGPWGLRRGPVALCPPLWPFCGPL